METRGVTRAFPNYVKRGGARLTPGSAALHAFILHSRGKAAADMPFSLVLFKDFLDL